MTHGGQSGLIGGCCQSLPFVPPESRKCVPVLWRHLSSKRESVSDGGGVSVVLFFMGMNGKGVKPWPGFRMGAAQTCGPCGLSCLDCTRSNGTRYSRNAGKNKRHFRNLPTSETTFEFRGMSCCRNVPHLFPWFPPRPGWLSNSSHSQYGKRS